MDLRVARAADGLRIEVTNPLTSPPEYPESGRGTTGSGGRGLTGMAERVRVLGGDLDTGRRDGQWRVSVRLPATVPGADR